MTLSDKSMMGKNLIPDNTPVIKTSDVKDFIRTLKEDFLVKTYKDFEELINELAGDKLI